MPLRAHPRERQRWRGARRERQRHLRRQSFEHHRERGIGSGRAQRLQVVEDEHDGARLDTLRGERDRCIAGRPGRVLGVERDPREGPLVAIGPIAEQRGLAVPGGGDQRDEGLPGGLGQRASQARPLDRARGRRPRHAALDEGHPPAPQQRRAPADAGKVDRRRSRHPVQNHRCGRGSARARPPTSGGGSHQRESGPRDARAAAQCLGRRTEVRPVRSRRPARCSASAASAPSRPA